MTTTIQIDPEDLRAVLDAVVREVLGLLDWPAGRLTLTEEEAAQAVGVPKHVLRDARLAGDLRGRRMGKRVVYLRQDLLDYLTRPENGHESIRGPDDRKARK